MVDDVISEFPRPAVDDCGRQIIELHMGAGGALAFELQSSGLDLGFRHRDGCRGCASGGQQEQRRDNYAQKAAAHARGHGYSPNDIFAGVTRKSRIGL
jgi:hypothetical protein